MIGVLSDFPNREASSLVLSALRRSVSRTLAKSIATADLDQTDVVVSIAPNDSTSLSLLGWLKTKPRKLILFGRLSTGLKDRLGIQQVSWPEPYAQWACSPAALPFQSAESLAFVRYLPEASNLGASGWRRALERFDFHDEWNNLGFGAIRVGDSMWSLAEPVHAPAEVELARVEAQGSHLASYVAHFVVGDSAVLWVNRTVGLIDSFEWRLVEHYLAHWQSDSLPCVPVIREIPWGHDTAITMRLDCDEDVSSARPLWQAYRDMGVPLSLAIHTTNLRDETHTGFLKEFIASGGALLSHTATHAPNWGGSYEAAFQEGRESHDRILASTGVSVKYAVSPFHQSPSYALQALCDAGYHGCIGGIIRNDPEFLLARGGELAFLPTGFVGHSQQTMLHGDCMLSEGDPLRIFKAAFDRAYETHTMFGYLDHPFSPRYQYGWKDEQQRVEAHRAIVSYIRGCAENPLFLDEVHALDFLRARAAIHLLKNEGGFVCQFPQSATYMSFGVEYCGRSELLESGKRLS